MSEDRWRSKVSAVIPCFNHGGFMENAVSSLIRQTRPPLEIIIVDDGSTDKSLDICTALAKNEKRIRIARHATNQGTAAALNTGFDLANGNYLMALGADNWLAEKYIEETAAILDEDPETDIVYTDKITFGKLAAVRARKMRKHARECGVEWISRLDRNRFVWRYMSFESHAAALKMLKSQHNFIHSSALFRRGIWDAGIRFPVTANKWEDWYFWTEALEKGWRVRRLPAPYFFYRQDSGKQRNFKGGPP